jgi:hypothetical protein
MEESKPVTQTAQPEPKTSTLAILSLIFAIVGICFPPLALTLGIIALVRIKKNRATLKGKGLAIAGIIISTAIIIFLATFYIFPPQHYYMDGVAYYTYGHYDKAIV